MPTLYALWIDHAHAYLMKANAREVVSFEAFESDVEPAHRGAATPEHYTITNPNKDAERRQNQIHQFNKFLIEKLQGASEIVVFGPGMAKHEFVHALESHKALHEKLTKVETSDKLSENQLKAKTRELLKLPRP